MSDNVDCKDFSMTKEELDSFEKALKNEEFRKLLVEYAQEISDPENRKKYEEEITQMEKMRGMDVKFVNPEDGYVVKTVDTRNGMKAFVNICSNVHINWASSRFAEEEEESGKKKAGYQWNIPYSLSPPRDDFDRAGAKCIVYDCVFHPDTYKMGQKDTRFRQLMIDTALEGIEREFKAHLNRKGLKFPKMKFKGIKRPTLIRNKSTEAPEKSHQDFTIGGVKFPYPYDNNEPSNQEDLREREQKKVNGSNVPEYRIVHRGVIDFQNFTHARDSNTSTRPKELVIYIDLPQLESAARVHLDILEKQLILDCKQPSYHLELALPYAVDEENGTAKFEKSKRQLTVTLTVLPPPREMDQNLVEAVDTEDGLIYGDAEHQECSSTFQTTSHGSVESPLPSSGEVGLEDEMVALEALTEDVSRGDAESNKHNRLSMGDLPEPTISEEVPSKHTDVALEIETRHGAEKETDIKFELSYASSGLTSPCFFRCPPYSYHQDKETITFIIDVPKVALDSVSLGFNGNKAYISFPSEPPRPEELTAPDYALYIQFPVGQNVQEDLCNIDVSEDNLVLTLHKQNSCMELWDSFEAGSAEEHLETKYFVTQKTVQKMMIEIAEQDPWAGLKCEDASVKVSSVTDDCLTVEAEADFEKPSGYHYLSAEQQVHVDSAEDRSNKEYAMELNGEIRENRLSEALNSDDETRDNEARFAERDDSFVPIELINNAVRTRRSILRSSSTSTDDSYGDENEFSFSPESPSRKNVRFNLTPNVRVFSNKKDKKSRKLQARLNEESRKYSRDREESGSEQSNGNSPVEYGTNCDGFDWKSNGAAESVDSVGHDVAGNEEFTSKVDNVYIDCSNGDIGRSSTSVSNGSSDPVFGLTNTLIFELDD